MRKTGFLQPFTVGRDGLGDQYIFERSPLTGNFKGAVVIAALVFMVEFNQQGLHVSVFVDNLLGQDQEAAIVEAFEYPPDQRVAIPRVHELQGVIHDDHRSVVDLHLPDIMLGHVNLGFGAVELVVLLISARQRSIIAGDESMATTRQQGSVIP